MARGWYPTVLLRKPHVKLQLKPACSHKQNPPEPGTSTTATNVEASYNTYVTDCTEQLESDVEEDMDVQLALAASLKESGYGSYKLVFDMLCMCVCVCVCVHVCVHVCV